MREMTTRYEIRSVTRALDVLSVVGELGEADLTGVARAAGIHPTTALRVLETLRGRGFVRQRRGLYEIGPRAFEVGSVFLNRVSLPHEAQAIVEELAARVGETANLGVLVDGQVLYLAIAHAKHELGIQASAGGRHPAHCTALGKVLLAHLPWETVVESILEAHPPARLTSTTLVDPEDLRARARRRGASGLRGRRGGAHARASSASPPRSATSPGRVVAAISISGPRLRLPTRRIPATAKEVIEIADAGVAGAGSSGDAAAVRGGLGDTNRLSGDGCEGGAHAQQETGVRRSRRGGRARLAVGGARASAQATPNQVTGLTVTQNEGSRRSAGRRSRARPTTRSSARRSTPPTCPRARR